MCGRVVEAQGWNAGVPGSNPVVGTAYHSHQPTQLSIPSGSVNEYPGIFVIECHSGGTQAVGPHQL